MLIVKVPKCCVSELKYILDVMLRDFLGLDFNVFYHDINNIEISFSSDNTIGVYKNKLILDNTFFEKASKNWLNIKSLPNLPLKNWCPCDDGINANLVRKTIPILYGASTTNSSKFVCRSGDIIYMNLDIFGSCFFMLSRYEELIITQRDKHNRFSAFSSIAYKSGFLDRPIVNEYLEILWCSLKELWPHLNRKKRASSNMITCDVDWPYDPAITKFLPAFKKFSFCLLKGKSLTSAMKVSSLYFKSLLGFDVVDEYNDSIHWMLDINEKAGNRLSFYFIPLNTSEYDTDEDFNSSKLRSLFKLIASRGHDIGVHPGYNTYNNKLLFNKTILEFKRILKEEAINQNDIGGRQHFLRWDVSKTPHLWDDNCLTYDSSLSFADKSGFRCGVCYEFNMYDLINRKPFRLKQYPLINMESTIISPRYESLGYTKEALDRFKYFKYICHMYDGTYTLLWHNSHFSNKEDKFFYSELIS